MVTGLDLSNQRILITGGAGFLGRQVVKHLCEAGADPEKWVPSSSMLPMKLG